MDWVVSSELEGAVVEASGMKDVFGATNSLFGEYGSIDFSVASSPRHPARIVMTNQ